MRLLFVADGRSPTAINWIRYWVERGDEVHLASTFPCQPSLSLAGLYFIPTAFSGMKPPATDGTTQQRNPLWGAAALNLRLGLRHWAGPLTIPDATRHLKGIVDSVRPDLVHAMRIPFEGMLAALAGLSMPLIISIWGNDFTLHAPSTPLMRWLTRHTMRQAGALHTDCQRDLRLATVWGFNPKNPGIVLPGNGGIRTSIFHPPAHLSTEPMVINPRGFRNYVRNDTFFKAIPLILAHLPETRFLCPNMAGEAQVEKWLAEYGIAQAVSLLPAQPQAKMADHYRRAQVLVSPSTHDGTPNSLLEGMACGCFPVAGDLESIQEWITPGINGQLVDPSNPQALADAVIQALQSPHLRQKAAKHNSALIAAQAEYEMCMQRADKFYCQVNTKRHG